MHKVSHKLSHHEAEKASLGRYWRDILADIPDAVIVYSPSGDIVYANGLASKFLRFPTLENLLQQNLASLFARYRVTDSSGKVFKLEDMPTSQSLSGHLAVEQVMHFESLSEIDSFWLAAKAFPIISKKQQLKYVVSTYNEITSFIETEEHLRESNRRILAILDNLMGFED